MTIQKIFTSKHSTFSAGTSVEFRLTGISLAVVANGSPSMEALESHYKAKGHNIEEVILMERA